MAADEENKVAEWKLNKKIKVKNNEKKVTFSVDKGDLSNTGTELVGDTKIFVECDKADGTGKEFVDVTAATANTKFFAPATVVKVKFVIKNAKAYAGFDKFECKKADDSAFSPVVAFTAVAADTKVLEKVSTFPMPTEDCKVIGSLKKLVAPTFKSVKINNHEILAANIATATAVGAEVTKDNIVSKITALTFTVGGKDVVVEVADCEITAPTAEITTAQDLKIKLKAKDGMWLAGTEITIKVKQA